MLFLNRDFRYYKRRSHQITQKEKKWQVQRLNIQRENDIKNDYNNIQNKNPFKITTGKLAMWFLLLLCLSVIIFTGWVTLQEITLSYAIGMAPSFMPLITMIGAILGATIDVAAYFAKSAKENSQGGIVFEAAAANNFEEEPIRQPMGTEYDKKYGVG